MHVAPFMLLTLAATAWTANASDQPPRWEIDPVHSRVLIEVNHAGFTDSLGTLSAPEGELWFDPDTWEGTRVDVRLPLARLDFGDADWNAALAGRIWFAAEDHPVVQFRSTRVEPEGDDRARVFGDLTVRGQTREVVLAVQRHAVKRHPLTLRRTVGFSATTSLDRRDFGLTAYPRLVGTDVRIRLVVEAIRTRNVPPDAVGPTTPTPTSGNPPDAPDQHP